MMKRKLTVEELAARINALAPADRAALKATIALSTREGQPSPKSHATIELEQAGWRAWLKTLFPRHFSYEFSPHHVETWDWAWSIKPDTQPASFVAIWSRAHGKSSNSEAFAASLGARALRRYVLYVSGTQDQADDHVQNVGSLLESSKIERYYPDLAERAVGKFGNAKGWRRNRLRTKSGFTIDAIGLDTAARGVKLDEMRPDCIIVDDIDEETDSDDLVQKKIKVLTRSLIPAGAENVAILFVQNIVHKNSVFARLADGRADFLADRIVSGPTPALRRFDYIREGVGYRITAGEPTWEGMSLARCQEMVNDMGLRAFLAECQHDVYEVGDEKSFREYDEIYHIITWSEFAQVFKTKQIPQRWNRGCGLDWGTTTKHPTACVWVTRPYVADPLNDCIFVYREMCRPHYPALFTSKDMPEEEMVSPGRIARAIHEAESESTDAGNTVLRLMSHEASAAFSAFQRDLADELKVFFQKWRARKGSGVPQIQETLAIDGTLAHPFRRYPIGHPQAGQPLMGRPRLYFIVDDVQGALYVDGEGKLRVKQPMNERGMARLRAEMPEFDERRTGSQKIFDDAVDALRGIAAGFFVKPAAMTEREELEKDLPDKIKTLNIPKLPVDEQWRARQAQEYALWEKQQAEDGDDDDDFDVGNGYGLG